MKLLSVIKVIGVVLLTSCQKESQSLDDSEIIVRKLCWEEIVDPLSSEDDPFDTGMKRVLVQKGTRHVLPKSFSVNDLVFGSSAPAPPWSIEIDYFSIEREGEVRCVVGIEKSGGGGSNVGIFQFTVRNNKIEYEGYFFVDSVKWSAYLRCL